MPGITHFLFIAVENYHNEKFFAKVSFAENDASDVKQCFERLGYDNIVYLAGNHATKTAIEQNLKKIVLSAQADERIIIYFAGHGFSIAGRNLIAPVDAIPNNEDSCISTEYILGLLKTTKCKRNMLFLDCCHSGFDPGGYVRDSTAEFSSDDLAYNLRNETYCVGFASCQSHELSLSNPILKHGVWSHYLIEALSGDAGDIYKEGLLLSDQLQSYLTNKTREFVRKNRDDGSVQTPVQFGRFSDKFVIEDLSPIFTERASVAKASAYKLTNITIFDIDEGNIKDLPGFKSNHRVPSSIGDPFDSFVRSIAEDLIADEIERTSKSIKDYLDYTRKQIEVDIQKGYGAIETPDFVYTVEVTQSKENPKKYILERTLAVIVNPEIISTEAFNKLFDKDFRQLSFHFDRNINVNEFIDFAEPLEKKGGFKLDYNPADTSSCTINFLNSTTEIVITRDHLNITTPKAMSPKELLDVYKETSLQLEQASLKLLN